MAPPTLEAVTDDADSDLETIPLRPWTGTHGPGGPPASPYETSSPSEPSEPSAPRGSRDSLVALVAAIVVVSLVVGFAVATLVLNGRDSSSSSLSTDPSITTPNSLPNFPFLPLTPTTTPSSTTPPSTTPSTTPRPADPDEAFLGGLLVQQKDVPVADIVQLLDQGTDLGVATLDLCNGTFPSEALRTARRQVAVTNGTGTVLSTEAVLYGAASGGAQALAELKSVTAHCPATPVPSPVGERTVATDFGPTPDGAWPHTASVDRLAYDFVTVDPSTATPAHNVAVYLRRGRVLMGIYFPQPDGPQVAVEGHTTIPGIVGVFEARMANLPASLVNG